MPQHSRRSPFGVHGSRFSISQAVHAGYTETGAGPVSEHRLPGRLHVPTAPRPWLFRGRLGRVPAVHGDERGPRHVAVAVRKRRFRVQAAAHLARVRGHNVVAQPARVAAVVRQTRRLVAVRHRRQQRVAAAAPETSAAAVRRAVADAVVLFLDLVHGRLAAVRADALPPSATATRRAVPANALFSGGVHRCRRGNGQRRVATSAAVVAAVGIANSVGRGRRRGQAQGRCCGRRSVQVPVVHQDVLDRVRADQAPAAPLRGRPVLDRGQDVLLQVLRQGVQHAGRAQDAHPHAHFAVHLQAMRQSVQPPVAAPGPHSHAHRREAVLVPALQPRVRRQVQLARAPPDPLGREEVLVPVVQQNVQPHVAVVQALRLRVFDRAYAAHAAHTSATATATAAATAAATDHDLNLPCKVRPILIRENIIIVI